MYLYTVYKISCHLISANPLGILVANLLAPNVVQQQKDISLLVSPVFVP
jgi:hypothetical protein